MNVEWLHGEVEVRCPVCGTGGSKARVLAVDHVIPDRRRVTLLRCSCGAAFLSDLTIPDYGSVGGQVSHGLEYHVEQAFGFDPMAPVLLRLPPDSVRRCLDVGCAFGFMLDFARFTFGCEVVGVEPSGLGPAGAEALGLPIVHDYLTPALDLGREPFDLILCSEVLEHVADPHALLAAIAARLSPDGLLVLTTPNVDAVHAGAAPGDLVRTLSPGLHLVLFDAALLTRVLREAGFTAVRIEATPATLVAIAGSAGSAGGAGSARSAGGAGSARSAGGTRSAGSEESEGSEGRHALDRVAPACVDRSPLLRYFDARADQMPPLSALARGFAYRHFRDCVNAGDHAAAAVSQERVARLYGQRFGVDLQRPRDSAGAALAESVAAATGVGGSYNLPGVLYFSAILELNGRQDPRRAAEYFAATTVAADAILARMPSTVLDGETEALCLRSRVLLPMALAAFDAAGALRQLAALDALAIAGGIPAGARAEARKRVFVRLVHAGELDAAEGLAGEIARSTEEADAGEMVELETRYCIAMLALQRGRPREAAAGFGAVRRAAEHCGGDAATVLLWAAAYHEGLALQGAGAPREARRALEAVAEAQGTPRAGLPPVPDSLAAAARAALAALAAVPEVADSSGSVG